MALGAVLLTTACNASNPSHDTGEGDFGGRGRPQVPGAFGAPGPTAPAAPPSTSTPAPPSAPSDASLLFARDIAVDETDVYMPSQEGSLVRLSKSLDARPQRLAAGTLDALALDATHVYVAGAAGLMRVAKAGGAPELLVSGAVPRAVRVVGERAYGLFAQPAGDPDPPAAACRLLSVPITGGMATTLAELEECAGTDLAVDAGHAYVMRGATLERIPTAGGAAEPLHTITSDGAATDAYALAQDDTRVFVAGFRSKAITAVAKGDGAASVLVVDTGSPTRLIAGGASLVWLRASGITSTDPTAHNASIVAMPKSGGASTVLVHNLARPTALALDAKSVYCASLAAPVVKVALPSE